MKVAVYAVKFNQKWSIMFSLDLRIDCLWWTGQAGGIGGPLSIPERWILVSIEFPLGWAALLRDSFCDTPEMAEWREPEWRCYAAKRLEREMREERSKREDQDKRLSGAGILGSAERELVRQVHSDELPQASRLREHADTLADALSGRSLLEPEVESLLAERCPEMLGHWRSAAQLAHLEGRLLLEAAVGPAPAERAGPARGPLARAWNRLRRHSAAAALPRCRRCGSVATGRTACAACGLAGCAYCEACLALGRSRSCALLLRSAHLPAVRGTADPGTGGLARRWGLSAAQAEAAGAALRFLAEPRIGSAGGRPGRFLLWAVTGAGKTEMMFPLLEAVLAAGGRALIATPRRDVVLELAPRLARAFPAASISVLYGGSPDRWKSGALTLATTHQLLRFHRGFDLVIIDEIDAYPYHGDPMLAFAAEKACKPGGAFVYLSATPPVTMQSEIRQGQLAHARVPARFHGHPLPVPERLVMSSVTDCLKRGRLPAALGRSLQKSIERKAQVFVFITRIAQIEGVLRLLRRSLPGIPMEGTSSQDPERSGKVAAFRNREFALLVTTTILERGVTVPRSDVFVLDADNRLFDEASLVQMAGRAGRSQEDPNGRVVFASPVWSRAQRSARSQIRTMNTIARRKGYLREEEI
ncbi:DNA/RNA helicase [Paenibacillus sp. HN-1]|uniref:DEAD/DEAH box helicase n=1 Tax=Paenibacillus TaxID=44249 RepID=UPI001CA7EBCA|nr:MULTISPECIES: helicase-related protein [Paenibacillus]MBY9077616.1 DNA/RNA helicase [Paenibacillus sp. CGMCC 1.18879]MBY9087992.1 DNA/RNA helicase [Paenibacillus sinensis]